MHIDPAESHDWIDSLDVVHFAFTKLRIPNQERAKLNQNIRLIVLKKVSASDICNVRILQRNGLPGGIGRMVIFKVDFVRDIDWAHWLCTEHSLVQGLQIADLCIVSDVDSWAEEKTKEACVRIALLRPF